jgi:hypothetical protein
MVVRAFCTRNLLPGDPELTDDLTEGADVQAHLRSWTGGKIEDSEMAFKRIPIAS